MAKKKLDIRLNAEYMDNAAYTALANYEKAVQNREKYIWAIPKFRSQNIYENCNKETEVKEKDKFSLRENDNSETNQTLQKINSDRNQAGSHRPRQNVRERYQKQIAESRKYEAAVSHEDRQQNMSVEYLDSSKGTESMKAMPETNRRNKSVSSMQDVSGENQEFASGMVSAKNTHSGQFYQQMKKAPRPHSSQMLDEKKLSGDLHHTQKFLKRKQKVTFGSTGSIGNEHQQRRRIRREFKSPEKNNSPKQYSSEEKCISEASEDPTKSLLCVKIWKNDVSHDFITYLSDLNRIKQKYPKLSEVMPNVDTEEKEVKYCLDAVKAIMKSLFQPPDNFDAKLESRLAIEILAASRSWEIRDFRSNFQKHFLQNVLSQNNVKELYLLAQHFEENEICDACRNFAKDDAIVNLKMPKYGQKACFVKIDSYDEPLQFPIQLAEAATDFFIDSLPTDISNEITFEAISGSYAIKGFEVTLKDDLKADTLPALEISYDVTNDDENISVHEQKRKPQRSKIVIYLKKKLIVKPNQKGKITVETRIKPCSCFVVESENVTEENLKGKFSLSMTSTRKNNFNEKRFLVGKLLYNYL